MISMLSSAHTRSMSRRLSPFAISASIALTTCALVLSGTAKQMLCSLDDCEIINTRAFCAATAEKVRAAMPGTPIMPRPATVTRLTSRIA